MQTLMAIPGERMTVVGGAAVADDHGSVQIVAERDGEENKDEGAEEGSALMEDGSWQPARLANPYAAPANDRRTSDGQG